MWLQLKSGLRLIPQRVLEHEQQHKSVQLCIRGPGSCSCKSQPMGATFQLFPCDVGPLSGGQFPRGWSSCISLQHPPGHSWGTTRFHHRAACLLNEYMLTPMQKTKFVAFLRTNAMRQALCSAFYLGDLSLSPQQPCEAGADGTNGETVPKARWLAQDIQLGGGNLKAPT